MAPSSSSLSSRTIAEHKSAFLRSQIRNLSAPLEPAADWRDYAPKRRRDDNDDNSDDDDDDDEGDGDIPDKIIKDVLAKSHATLRQHNRAVFSAQAIHHVSRQIEGLYWQQVKDQNAHKGVDEFDALAGDDDGSVRRNVFVRGSDYSNETNIARLPDRLDDGESNFDDVTPEAQQRYTALRARLTGLVSSLKQQQRQMAQYKHLRELLGPYEAPRDSIQPNLVMRGGELVGEVEKMRMLVARVSGRLAERSGM